MQMLEQQRKMEEEEKEGRELAARSQPVLTAGEEDNLNDRSEDRGNCTSTLDTRAPSGGVGGEDMLLESGKDVRLKCGVGSEEGGRAGGGT